MTSSGVDVVIVGGGPAGAAAAITSAAAGLRVLLLERAAFPRHAVGETLHPGASVLFRQLGVAEAVDRAGFIRHAGIWREWNGPREFIPFGSDGEIPWLGYQAWRATFDSILLDRARAVGVDVRQSCAVRSPVVDRSGRVRGVRTDSATTLSTTVIDATGRARWLGRHIGLPARVVSAPLVARFGYVRAAPSLLARGPLLKATSREWTWVAQVRPDTVHWSTVASDHGSIEAGLAGLPLRLLEQPSLGRIQGADVTWRMERRIVGLGYVMAGDAACALDPLSGHGVLRALMSGMYASNVATAALEGPDRELRTGREYATWLRAWFDSDAATLSELYQELRGDRRPARPASESSAAAHAFGFARF